MNFSLHYQVEGAVWCKLFCVHFDLTHLANHFEIHDKMLSRTSTSGGSRGGSMGSMEPLF